jgi:hypothetical protein
LPSPRPQARWPYGAGLETNGNGRLVRNASRLGRRFGRGKRRCRMDGVECGLLFPGHRMRSPSPLPALLTSFIVVVAHAGFAGFAVDDRDRSGVRRQHDRRHSNRVSRAGRAIALADVRHGTVNVLTNTEPGNGCAFQPHAPQRARVQACLASGVRDCRAKTSAEPNNAPTTRDRTQAGLDARGRQGRREGRRHVF